MNLTLSIDKKLEKILKQNKYIKWTEIARDAIKEKAIEIQKKEILNKYIKKETLTKNEEEFLETIDWHPVDEFDLKPELINEIRSQEKDKIIKLASPKIKYKKK